MAEKNRNLIHSTIKKKLNEETINKIKKHPLCTEISEQLLCLKELGCKIDKEGVAYVKLRGISATRCPRFELDKFLNCTSQIQLENVSRKFKKEIFDYIG